MPHYLTVVRNAVVTALTGLPTTGNRVYNGDISPLQPDQVPGLIVTTHSPLIAFAALDVQALQADVEVTVDAIARGTGLASLMDTIAGEVQVAMHGITSIGGRPVKVAPQSIDRIMWDFNSEQPVARRMLVYRVAPIYVLSADPTTFV